MKKGVMLILLGLSIVFSQSNSKRVLFIGNSYTGVNNLPQMVYDVSLSVSDTIIFDSNTPGGYTFEAHSTNATTLAKIAVGNWDYVVLQEQSQRPSFPIAQVETSVFPYAEILDSIINTQNVCAETVFYMTWGRKNGDASNCASWPPVCTYNGMDSLLRLRYEMMANSNDAILSPVGAVWKYIRQTYPTIELYSADESHPSISGTYAAACTFYSTIFRKDPTFITYNPGISPSDAANIRLAAKEIVFDSLLNWNIGVFDPQANFTYVQSGANEITFTNISQNSTNYNWNFGDGNNSTSENPIHLFSSNGSYNVTLYSSECSQTDSVTITITIAEMNTEIENDVVRIFPNPATNFIMIDNFKITSYEITSLRGEIIQNGNLNNGNMINIQHLNNGIYFIKLKDGSDQLHIMKLIVSKK